MERKRTIRSGHNTVPGQVRGAAKKPAMRADRMVLFGKRFTRGGIEIIAEVQRELARRQRIGEQTELNLNDPRKPVPAKQKSARCP